MEILKAFGNTERTLQKKEPKGCEYCVLGKSLSARLECAYELESCCHLGGDISDPVFGFVGGRRGSGPLQIKVFGLSRRNRGGQASDESAGTQGNKPGCKPDYPTHN